MSKQHYTVFETTAGFCGIAWNEVGITRFQLPSSTAEATERLIAHRAAGSTPGEPPAMVSEAIGAARRYFAGEPVDFAALPLDLGEQDAFFARVYAALRQVGWGHTTTYGALTRQLGAEPMAARDVGQAMARNPVPLIIPCHRVLAAGGKVGGFSASGGSAAKTRMLELEGVSLSPPPAAQNSFAF